MFIEPNITQSFIFKAPASEEHPLSMLRQLVEKTVLVENHGSR